MIKAIIMPVWAIDSETIHVTQEAIDSIRESSDVPIFIVDNGSTVGRGYLKSAGDEYIRNEINLGYAPAVNQGMSWFKTDDFVVIANNDIRVPTDWEEKTNDILKQFGNVGSVHYRMIPYTQGWGPGEDTWVGGKERWCNASFFLTRVFQKYDEEFKNGGEDWDYFQRLRDKGYKQVYTNKVEYQHLDSYTRQKEPHQKENDYHNEEYYKSKHGMYPEEHLASQYPNQFKIPWRPFP